MLSTTTTRDCDEFDDTLIITGILQAVNKYTTAGWRGTCRIIKKTTEYQSVAVEFTSNIAYLNPSMYESDSNNTLILIEKNYLRILNKRFKKFKKTLRCNGVKITRAFGRITAEDVYKDNKNVSSA